MNKLDGCVARIFSSLNSRSKAAAVLAVSAALLSTALATNVGCRRGESPEQAARHGASQQATAQEKERQNRNLIDQVVRATEEQENFPDLAYLRGALGRLDGWLAERPANVDFVPDAEFEKLAEDCAELAKTASDGARLFALFADESGKPTEQDASDFQATVDRASTQTAALAEAFDSDALRRFGEFVDDIKTKLANAREFQFADPIETFQTQIRQTVKSPFYNFETLATGIAEFGALLKTDARAFRPQDADFLRESVWVRDAFGWAKGEKQDDLTIVRALFDWTVDNVVVSPAAEGPAGPIAQLVWQTLLTGEGTAFDRALVFIELLRQHRLDAFVVRPEGDVPADFPLVVGVRLGGETYLFLPELGIPIPGPGADSVVFDEKAGLTVASVATLAQVADDDSLLRRLDLDAERVFPAKADRFKRVVALVPATPFLSSDRMTTMEQEFSGSKNTVLSTPFDAQRERIAALAGIAEVARLRRASAATLEQILFPFESELTTSAYSYKLAASGNLEVDEAKESGSGANGSDEMYSDYTASGKSGSTTSAEPNAARSGAKEAASAPLWIGKILYLKGLFVDETGAARWLQQARVSDRALKLEASQIPQKLEEAIEQYVEWTREKTGAEPSEEAIRAVAQQTAAALQADVATKRYIKVASKYCLALLSEAAGNDDAAISHLQDANLQRSPDASWRLASSRLLAKLLERRGNVAGALKLYRAESGDYGRDLRAKLLAEATGTVDEAPAENAPNQEAQPAETPAETPAESAPAESAPDQNAQPVETPVESAPDQNAQPAETPVESAPDQNAQPAETPVENAPNQEAQPAEAPAE